MRAVGGAEQRRRMVGGAADHHPVEAAREERLRLVEAGDAAVEHDRELGEGRLHPHDELVVERRDLAVLLRAEALAARPCAHARRPAAPPPPATAARKAGRTASGSWSSTPMRHLTVTGTGPAASIIAAAQSATSSGVRISAAPKQPDCTRSDGQPTLRLISSKPRSRADRGGGGELRGLRPAELQRQRLLLRAEGQQPLPVARAAPPPVVTISV